MEQLTNEKISKRFINQFDLVNYAIRKTEDMVMSGRPPRVKKDTENPALLVLEEILTGKDTVTEDQIEEEKKSKNEDIVEESENVVGKQKVLSE